MKLLITGGAGYIGSATVRYAQELGHEVAVLDDFSSGHRWAVRDCEIFCVDLLEQLKLRAFLRGRYFDGVIHFAAKSLVAESIAKPDLYYTNNVIGSINLINEMLANNVTNIVFSSTAAVYGNPLTKKIKEDHPKEPINPYGRSKLMVEKILTDLCAAQKLSATCLRYFNAAGAHESGDIGEAHFPETHLIPNAINSLLDTSIPLKIYGNDYPTVDGTSVRDYIHVTDLARAHILAIEHNFQKIGFSEFNLGCGNGFSVLEVIKAVEAASCKNIDYQFEAKRNGDPVSLVADTSKALNVLGWSPEYRNIDDIIQSAWKWHMSDNYQLLRSS